MSLRKFMHSRNKYKNPPDFKKLAILYPEFLKVAITDLTGKVTIDFKDEESLRVLTQILLKHDFNLNVTIPPNKLVPTLPLRLNYILWIEDLMKHASLDDWEQIHAIDIGTGAVCIYPLLLAKMYGCHIIGTEIDVSSVAAATENVQKNDLQQLIKVLKVSGETIIKDVLEHDATYHFSMCNPPFFEDKQASDKIAKKLPPRNAPTGNVGELMTPGGEREFVTNMIEESIEVKERIKVYTTMIGRRCNLVYLIKLLRKKNIQNMTWTEFCQGHTKRWGLAWSFLSRDVINLEDSPVIRKSEDYISKLLKDQRPSEIIFPMPNEFSSLHDFVKFLQTCIAELNIQRKECELCDNEFNGYAWELIAEEDTWSHARRKRRLAMRQTEIKSDDDKNTDSEVNTDAREAGNKQTQLLSIESCKAKDSLLAIKFFVDIIDYERKTIKICMILDKGTGGKNALETFRQYLINKLNVREYVRKQSCKPTKRKRKRMNKNSEGSVNCEHLSRKESVSDQEETSCPSSSIEYNTESL